MMSKNRKSAAVIVTFAFVEFMASAAAVANDFPKPQAGEMVPLGKDMVLNIPSGSGLSQEGFVLSLGDLNGILQSFGILSSTDSNVQFKGRPKVDGNTITVDAQYHWHVKWVDRPLTAIISKTALNCAPPAKGAQLELASVKPDTTAKVIADVCVAQAEGGLTVKLHQYYIAGPNPDGRATEVAVQLFSHTADILRSHAQSWAQNSGYASQAAQAATNSSAGSLANGGG
jgi:hypothetical protein